MGIAITLLVVVGYFLIIVEKFLQMNKAAIALVTAVLAWLIFSQATEPKIALEALATHLAVVSQIIFFLLAAMVIVELVDTHQGFKIITDILYTTSHRRMLWFLLILSFFLSAVLDNLTTMIVMISLLRKLVHEIETRWFMGSMMVISVNAGGVWTPIGDVTTTMLWIGEKISTVEVMKTLFLPSVATAAVAGLLATFFLKKGKRAKSKMGHLPLEPGAKSVLIMGLTALILIPVWKGLFNLPPFLGALFGLGVIWVITDIIHYRHGEKRWHLRVPQILAKIDFSGIIFFLGILLTIGALDAAGLLKDLALYFEKTVPNQNIVAILIGLASSIIDNVPLVAATMGMYDYPLNHPLWMLIAYAAGTGGSILIIGSAPGVAFMGLEKVDFIWYLRKISWIALISYFAGILVYFLYPALARISGYSLIK